jgi:hypothetical protein
VALEAPLLARVTLDRVRRTRRGALVECDTTLYVDESTVDESTVDESELRVAVQGRATLWLPPAAAAAAAAEDDTPPPSREERDNRVVLEEPTAGDDDLRIKRK